MSRSRAKGTAAETAVVGALQRLGWADAERRALQGALDRGDISGVRKICIEVKDTNNWTLAAWMRETEEERVNALADFGILVVKLPGIGLNRAEKWITVMDGPAATKLWFQAGEPRLRSTTVAAVGLEKGVLELVERERHCGTTPVAVSMRKRASTRDPFPGSYDLMRLDARCSLLRSAGYGGHDIIDVETTGILKETTDDHRIQAG